MANVRLASAAQQAAGDAIVDLIDIGGAGTIQIRSGTQPATANDAATGSLLATLTWSATAFGDTSTGGVVTAATITEDTYADTTGTASWARVLSGGGATIFDCDVGTTDATILLNSVNLVEGAVVSITEFYLVFVDGTLTPISINQTVTGQEDTDYNGQLEARIVSGLTPSFSKQTDPVYGAVQVYTNGTFTYTPDPGPHFGSDSFDWYVSDGTNPTSALATLTILIEEVAQALVITLDDTNPDPGDTVGVASFMLGGQSYTPVGTPTYQWVIYGADGSQIAGGSSATTTIPSGTGFDDQHVGGQLRLIWSDDNHTEVYSDLTDYIGAPNPLTTAGSAEVLEDDAVTGDVSDYARSPENLPLTYSVDTDVSNGVLDLLSDGSFTYTPTAGDHVGTDSFKFDVTDGVNADPAATTVSLTILPIPRVTAAVVAAGTADPTFLRDYSSASLGANASFTATAGETVVDYNGVTQTAVANEARFKNARRGAYNLLSEGSLTSGSSTSAVSVSPGVFVFRMASGSGTATFSGTASGSSGTLDADGSSPTAKPLFITTSGTIIVTASVATLTDIQLEETTTNKLTFVPSEFRTGTTAPVYYTYENGNSFAEGHGTAVLSGDNNTFDTSLGDWVSNGNGSLTYNGTDKLARHTATIAARFEAMRLLAVISASTDYRLRMLIRRSHTTNPSNWDMMFRATGSSGSWTPFANLLPNDSSWHWVELEFNTGANGTDIEVAQNNHTAVGDWFELSEIQVWPYTSGNDTKVITEANGTDVPGPIVLLMSSTDTLSYSGISGTNEVRAVTDVGTVDVDDWDGVVDDTLLGVDDSGEVTSIAVYNDGERPTGGEVDTGTLTITVDTNTVNTDGFSLVTKDTPISDPEVVTLSDPIDGSSTITFTTGYVYDGEIVLLSYAPGNVVDAVNARPLATVTDFTVTNNSNVDDPGGGSGPPDVTSASTISLTTTQDEAYYDGFRVYIDSAVAPNHAYEGPGPSITFGQLSPQVSLGEHTLYIVTYNALGESTVTPTVSFNMT